jgi:quercetin dioxygenase-like cupin family protein
MQSVTAPPGSGNQFHRHPGDQWTAIQEGEITFTVKGQAPVVLKAGDSNYVPRGTIHRQQNLTDKPARYRDADFRQGQAGRRADRGVGRGV